MRMTCTTSALQRDILATTYEDLQKMIYYTVHRFVQRYGGDFDELFAEANRIFVEACGRYDPARGHAITTYIYCSIHRGLCSLCWRERKRLNGSIEIPLSVLIKSHSSENANHGSDFEHDLDLQAWFAAHTQETTDDIKILLSDVSDDCKNIVYLLFEPPEDLSNEIYEYPTPELQRACLEEYLRFKLKWAQQRIENTFNEIREVLAS